MYQLTKRRTALIDLGSAWYLHVQEFSPVTDWPAAIRRSGSLAGTATDGPDDEWYDLGDFGALPEDILEIDDQHAAFLDGQRENERDEVERLVAFIEAASENGG
jgi:hypothetical protein